MRAEQKVDYPDVRHTTRSESGEGSITLPAPAGPITRTPNLDMAITA